MKKILLLIFPIFWSCNASIEVSPTSSFIKKSSIPDFNFVATPAYDFVFPNSKQTYILPIELYLRPFEGVSDTSNFVLEFESNRYAQLIILKDTLFPGDKKRINYSDFKAFRIVPNYQTGVPGEHTLSFSIATSGVKKSSNFKITANN